ncbi:MAG: 5'/3'-nucleotidase SurE [Oscillospiraceae bacterium]
MSQKLTIFQPLEVEEHDFPLPVAGAYSIGGTPADCVKTALKAVLPIKPDVVFSGINIGYNTGFDIAYSGTVAAAIEAVLNGIPAIAFSAQHDGSYDVTDRYILDIARELLAAPLGPGEIWNVNFPGCPLDEFHGILHERTMAPVHIRQYLFRQSPQRRHDAHSRRRFHRARGRPCGQRYRSRLHGYISIGKVKSMVL